MRTFISAVFWGSLIALVLFCSGALLIGAWRLLQWGPWTRYGFLAAFVLFGVSGYLKAIVDFIRRGA